ncbi:MAG: hypothetical protein JWM11_6551 [Planctomycetaceae bacterium]|nr:hypothetical protein [Planctomycetaceae bacterium]
MVFSLNRRLPLLTVFSVFVALATVCWPLGKAEACPFCGAAQMTLAEQLAAADAAVLVQWVDGVKDTAEKPGTTTYQIKQVVKAPKSAKKEQKITLDRYRVAKPGELFFILGTDMGEGKGVEWGSPLEVSETSFNYMSQAPSPEAPPAKRLAYFLKFLEFSDPIISNDAFAEFANAQYKDVEQLSPLLPREQIRKWISNPETQATRLGLYGMMIGLCGDDTDAVLLEKRILVKSDEFRLGIDGLMGGYLLIKKEKGLDVLDEHKLKDKKIPFSETFAAMQALRFMWSYGTGRIAPDRLRQSMRILLDRPEMADLVIADLARWKDWSIQDHLMSMYGEGAYDVPSIKRAIIRFMLVSSKDLANSGGAQLPEHVAKGQKLLEELRKKDPKTVSEAERFFIVP